MFSGSADKVADILLWCCSACLFVCVISLSNESLMKQEPLESAYLHHGPTPSEVLSGLVGQ